MCQIKGIGKLEILPEVSIFDHILAPKVSSGRREVPTHGSALGNNSNPLIKMSLNMKHFVLN